MIQPQVSMPSSFAQSRLTVARRRLLDRLLDQLLELEPEGQARKLEELELKAPRLTAWLRELVAADLGSQDPLETLFQRVGKAAELAAQPRTIRLKPGTRLGPWRVIESAGSGGMGTVYRAERADQAFQMVVAIKLIRLARASLEARLRLERELLARLDHRNVARLIDGGTTAGGQAYLVMEWVEGRDLDTFVNENSPDLSQRLDLFEQMAEGVVHAHQQRVIHGDLKPSNVRVADDGRVCLVDFGVARLIAEDDEPESSSCRALTPAFSAPEQLAGKAATTLSDVWAMGVMLEWLVTGDLPPVKAAGRQTPHLSPSTPRKADIQAILRQACHKDPGSRYAGVEQLLDDLRRYRAGFPVRAMVRNRWLVMQRFVSRHRLAVGAAAGAVAALCLALAGALWQAREATLERDRASAEASRALLAEQEASRLAVELQAVVDFQEAQLGRIDPASMGLEIRDNLISQRRDTLEREGMGTEEIALASEAFTRHLAGINLTDLARTALDENIVVPALLAMDEQFSEQPLVRARLLQALAVTARNLGLLERALPAQLEALAVRQAWLEDLHPDTIDSMGRTASLYGSLGDRDQALALHDETLEASREVFGEEHPNTLTALNNYATLVNARGDHAQAEPWFRQVLKGRRALLGDDDPDTIVAASNLGAALSSLDRHQEARPYYLEVLQRRMEALGKDHPDTLRAVANKGMLLVEMDDAEQALPYYQSALEGRRRVLGNNHPQTLQSVNNMGFLLSRMARNEEALDYYLEVIERSRELLGDRHPNTLIYINNTGTLYRNMGDLEAAEQLASEAVASGRAVLAPDNWHLAVFLAGYGLVLVEQQRFDPAEDALLEAYERYEQALGDTHPRTVSLIPDLVNLYESWHEQAPEDGHLDRAAAWQEREAEP
ncbi:MAG: serine/threonine protein kinase [Wenzhouxiangella sp.]|nr:MAG: serine/threonine protein kinase [Wenzhouxiangella sp.]